MKYALGESSYTPRSETWNASRTNQQDASSVTAMATLQGTASRTKTHAAPAARLDTERMHARSKTKGTACHVKATATAAGTEVARYFYGSAKNTTGDTQRTPCPISLRQSPGHGHRAAHLTSSLSRQHSMQRRWSESRNSKRKTAKLPNSAETRRQPTKRPKTTVTCMALN
ncbi:hypothetical protein CPC08DRAFT_783608, partial [Agrocybe pediades]